ncbi:MAG: hypothetical protein ACRBG0_00745 [Lewinella sp.]|uniref:hypothetical protein n=1 Tax=Lewinella sp. TaxID=2004506 RepID=UPI003D6ACBB1
MKKIFIPTDFTPESLELVEYAVLNHPSTQLNIILLAGFRSPDKRWDLIHLNPKKEIWGQLNSRFKEFQRRLLLDHKESIVNISFELFTGINSYAFRNFLELHGVEDAVVPAASVLHYRSEKWFDPTSFIKENVKNVIEVPIERTKEVPKRKFSITSLFNL